MQFCSGHQLHLPLSAFYKSSITAGETRCKTCNGQARRKRRRQDPLRLLQWKLYISEHRRSKHHNQEADANHTGCGTRREEHGVYPSLELVQNVADRFGGASAIDGALHPCMCITRFYPHLPLHLHPWNAVLVTSLQARRLPRGTAKRLAVFPASLCNEMHTNLCASFLGASRTVS